mmetsp:Transcript_30873/g.84736  ORF Transcript_30873/g.84736 Transcript_30873/m.84736 type:complete len:82 (+) Transcript_30873:46-291(+)
MRPKAHTQHVSYISGCLVLLRVMMLSAFVSSDVSGRPSEFASLVLFRIVPCLVASKHVRRLLLVHARRHEGFADCSVGRLA